MQIVFDCDVYITCADCLQPAIQREVEVRHGTHSRRVPFQTHARSLADDEQAAAFSRLEAFYSRFFDLLDELQAIQPGDCKLTYGRLTSLDLGAVMPSACARRAEIVPLAFVRVAGLTREIQLEARPIDGANVADILTDLMAAAEPIAATLNAQVEARDF